MDLYQVKVLVGPSGESFASCLEETKIAYKCDQGQRGFLIVEINPYNPIGIECFSPTVPTPPVRACHMALDTVPFSEQTNSFSRVLGSGDVFLPRTYIDRKLAIENLC